MNIQQIRNATLIVKYAEKKFLIDPFLAEKGTYPPFPNSARQNQNNPLVSLPIPIDHIISDIDAVIITHLHQDHYDDTAKKVLPKEIKVFVQNEEEAQVIKNDGFQNIEVLANDTIFKDIQIIKTKGEHGRGEMVQLAGNVCGVIFKHSMEKTLYVAGDTVWYGGVQEEIEKHQPEIIVVNAGDNQFFEGGPLVMGKDDVYKVYQASPSATIIASHMEAVNHWTLSRDELRYFINEKGIDSNVLVPNDGDYYSF